jgi:hypothetical protein
MTLSKLFVSASLVCLQASAQEIWTLPNHIRPSYSVRLSHSPDVTYHYRVANGGDAEQSLWIFHLVLATPVQILEMAAPSGWDPGADPPGELRTMSWFSGDSLMIAPGVSLEGFSVSCASRPSLTRMYAEGWVPLPVADAEDILEAYGSQLTPYGYGVLSLAVGPTAIDTPVVALAFLDSIRAYVDSSAAMGWITAESVRQKYQGFCQRVSLDLSSFAITRSFSETICQQPLRPSQMFFRTRVLRGGRPRGSSIRTVPEA